MEAFGTVLIAVAVIAIVVACLSFLGSGGVYRGLGKTGGLSLDESDGRPGPPRGSAAAAAEAEAEIRQMLEAKSARMERRGEEPLDVDAELAALSGTGPAGVSDPALREEVRDLVIAHNARRARRGEEPLDVESEVDRQLRKFGA